MRKLDPRLIIVVIFILAAGLYYFYRSSAAGPMDTYGKSVEEDSQNEANKKSDNETIQNKVKSDASIAQASSDNSGAEPQTEKLQKLQAWLGNEAKNLDQPHVDTKQKDLELKKRIENFSDAEKKLVLATSIDSKRPANERILSAYMLVLDESQAGVPNLAGLANKALPDFGPVTAHSEAEIRRGQELAVRYMAVDELAKRASTQPEALETLKSIANSGESAEIRGYAQRVLKQIK